MKNLLIIRESIWWPHLAFAEVECCPSQRVRTVLHIPFPLSAESWFFA